MQRRWQMIGMWIIACGLGAAGWCIAAPAAQAYAGTGVLVSTNLLAAEGGARRIVSFSYTASAIPAGTALKISFSQYGGDSGTKWYDSAKTMHGWDTMSAGTHTIDLTGLHWSGSQFYYRVWFSSDDGTETPVLDAISLAFDSNVGQVDTYSSNGTLLSTNLLAGERVVTIDTFSYDAASIPSGTTLTAQFSQDNATWYSAAGVLGGSTTLTAGSNSLNLSALGWSTPFFYYRIRFASDGVATPRLDSVSVAYTADTTAPSAPTILSPANGTATGSTTPLFTGTGSEAGNTVKVFSGAHLAAVLCSATVGTAPTYGWSCSPSSPMAEGLYDIVATETDGSSNESVTGSTLALRIDVSLPSAPGTPDLIAASDTGSGSTDNLTNDTTPTFTVSCESSATVTLLSGSTAIGSGTCASETVSITSSSLTPDGQYAIRARQTDAAGNVSATGAALTITLDTTAPRIVALSPADDATGVAVDSNLIVTFSETISRIGTGSVILHKSSDDSIVETIAVTSALVTGSGTTDTITVNPSVSLAYSTAYYVTIDGSAFPDSAGNFLAAITGSTVWNFTTVAAPVPASSSSSSAAPVRHGGGVRPETLANRVAQAQATILARFEGEQRLGLAIVAAEQEQAMKQREEERAASEREAAIAKRIAEREARIAEFKKRLALRRQERMALAVALEERRLADEQAALLQEQQRLQAEQEMNAKKRADRLAKLELLAKEKRTITVPSLEEVAQRRGKFYAVVGDMPVLYRDVGVADWYAPYVSYLVQENIATGYADTQGRPTGIFGVSNSVTYAEVLKMALESTRISIAGLPPPRNGSARGSWAAAYVAAAETQNTPVLTPDLDVFSPATRATIARPCHVLRRWKRNPATTRFSRAMIALADDRGQPP